MGTIISYQHKLSIKSQFQDLHVILFDFLQIKIEK